MTQARKKQKTNQLRIIGGQWRGRKLDFPDVLNLRPTGDRIRETLFNWLQADIAGARCLDLFAGSGALGFEALSRGAAEVFFVESHAKAVSQLKENSKILSCGNAIILKSDALDFLQKDVKAPFDIVFLDPPFKLELMSKVFNLLENVPCLAEGAKVYIEMDVSTEAFKMPNNWNQLKEKKAGQVKYELWEIL